MVPPLFYLRLAAQTSRSTGNSSIQIHGYANTQIHEYMDTRIYRYSRAVMGAPITACSAYFSRKSAALLQDHLPRDFHACSQPIRLSVISTAAYSSLLCMWLFSLSYWMGRDMSRGAKQDFSFVSLYFLSWCP